MTSLRHTLRALAVLFALGGFLSAPASAGPAGGETPPPDIAGVKCPPFCL